VSLTPARFATKKSTRTKFSFLSAVIIFAQNASKTTSPPLSKNKVSFRNCNAQPAKLKCQMSRKPPSYPPKPSKSIRRSRLTEKCICLTARSFAQLQTASKSSLETERRPNFSVQVAGSKFASSVKSTGTKEEHVLKLKKLSWKNGSSAQELLSAQSAKFLLRKTKAAPIFTVLSVAMTFAGYVV